MGAVVISFQKLIERGVLLICRKGFAVAGTKLKRISLGDLAMEIGSSFGQINGFLLRGSHLAHTAHPPNVSDLDCKISEFILPSSGWNKDKLQQLLPLDVCNKILSIHIPYDTDFQDTIIWNSPNDDLFSTKAAYKSIYEVSETPPSQIFKLVWKWKGPQRIKLFLWMVAHDSLLTNVTRHYRHLTSNNLCPIYVFEPKTLLHTSRDCGIVHDVWLQLVDPIHKDDFFGWDREEWLSHNLTK